MDFGIPRFPDERGQLFPTGIEFLVIGYSVSGPANGNLCNAPQVGTGTNRDSTSDPYDRNVAKCVASSTPGTNDHHFEAPTATDLTAAFTQIGKIISTRLIR